MISQLLGKGEYLHIFFLTAIGVSIYNGFILQTGRLNIYSNLKIFLEKSQFFLAKLPIWHPERREKCDLILFSSISVLWLADGVFILLFLWQRTNQWKKASGVKWLQNRICSISNHWSILTIRIGIDRVRSVLLLKGDRLFFTLFQCQLFILSGICQDV